MKIYDETNERLSPDDIEQLQLEKLQALIARLQRNVRRYRETLSGMRIESLNDLSRLPATEPDDLLRAFPYGMFALPLREVIRLHSTVGPRGKPLVIGHTRNDLAQWGRLVARQLTAANVSDHDVIQICYGGGILAGASGYTLGAELIEASVIPEDPAHIDYQLAMLRNYKATVLITTPTNARELAELLEQRGIDPQSLNLLTVLLSRPVSAEERDELHSGLFAEIRCSFGVPEILDPGLCVECSAGRFHVNEDHFVVEAVDGELIVTTLCREAMPLLRYATRQACELYREKCSCGRSGIMLEPGKRLDRRMRVNERILYDEQIISVLEQTRAQGHPFLTRTGERRIVVVLPVTAEIFSDTMRNLVDIKQSIESEFLARLGIPAEVRFVSQADFDQQKQSNPAR